MQTQWKMNKYIILLLIAVAILGVLLYLEQKKVTNLEQAPETNKNLASKLELAAMQFISDNANDVANAIYK